MRYLIISAHHDYRTPNRASLHFIADELAKIGLLRFFSMRFSRLSRRKRDPRIALNERANSIESVDGVECFLWRTLIHPFNFRFNLLRPLENLLFFIYQYFPNPTLSAWIKESDVIIYESGITPIFFDLAKRLSPKAKHIYLANDDLETIKASQYAHKTLARVSRRMDAVCVVSKSMAGHIEYKQNVFYVPHGMNESLAMHGDPSPYGKGEHAVSVGSMLFDPSYFTVASHAFPEITFHVIGSGCPHLASYGKNVVVYGNMPYSETVRYIKHAQIGVAPYVPEKTTVYLADSSMKMLQYDFFSLPTVCPNTVVGEYASRFGYIPGNSESIIKATGAALAAPHERAREILSWSQVVQRLLQPAKYQDTTI